MRVAVLGGGIRALACAHYLRRAGWRPVIIDAGERLDPLVARCSFGSHLWDAFDLFVSSSDTALCGLLSELDMQAELDWSPASSFVFFRGRMQPVERWSDLSRLAGLSPAERLRKVTRAWCSPWLLDRPAATNLSARAWLSRRYGPEAFARFWKPMLHALLGPESSERVSAHRAKLAIRAALPDEQPCRGDIRGGFSAFPRALARSVMDRGARIRLDHPIRRMSLDGDGKVITVGECRERWDAVVVTLGAPRLLEILEPSLAGELARTGSPAPVESFELLSVAAFVRSPVRGPASTLVLDPGLEFSRIVDPGSEAVDARSGLRPLYLTRRCAADAARYCPADEVVEKQARETLRSVYPDLDPTAIEGVAVHRAMQEERSWLRGRASSPAPHRMGRTPIYLCGEDQNPLRLPGPEASVMAAREVAGSLIRDLGSSGSVPQRTLRVLRTGRVPTQEIFAAAGEEN